MDRIFNSYITGKLVWGWAGGERAALLRGLNQVVEGSENYVTAMVAMDPLLVGSLVQVP